MTFFLLISTTAFFLLLLSSYVFSSAETALMSTSLLKLHHLSEEGNRRAARIMHLRARPDGVLGAILVGNNIANVGATVLLTYTIQRFYDSESAVAVGSALLILVILIFCEVIPKTYAAHHPDSTAMRYSNIISLVDVIFKPVVLLLISLPGLLIRKVSGRDALPGALTVTEEEIRIMVSLGEEAGELEEEEKEMINSIFEFGDTVVHEVMVPRTDMICVDVESAVEEALDMLLESGHSRIPVYEDTVDNVVGILYARDLLACMRDGRIGVSIRETMRPAYYVPEAKKVDDLLRDLRRRRVHMAIVIDEYGGTAGLVTIEDLLEEIVGEIRDEYDVEEEELFRMLDERTWLVDARMSLDELNELLDTELPKDGFDSIGGYIYSEMGDIPSAGERLVLPEQGLEIIIDRTEGPRISRVKIIKPAPSSQED